MIFYYVGYNFNWENKLEDTKTGAVNILCYIFKYLGKIIPCVKEKWERILLEQLQLKT